MIDAVFVPDGPRFVATDLARGPWDPNAQHGGAPAALLMREFERIHAASGLVLARVTYEFLRPLPLAALEVHAQVLRPGRRVALLEGTISDTDGAELVRARALWIRPSETADGGEGSSACDVVAESGSNPGRHRAISGPLPRTDGSPPPAQFFDWARRPMFATDAMEIRFVSGAFSELGPATAWFRLRVPLVAGDRTSSLQRLAASADFGNGISAIVPWEDHLFINPDLTIYIDRRPVGEWIHLDARTRIVPDGIGISNSELHDECGPVGHATQALLVQRTVSQRRP